MSAHYHPAPTVTPSAVTAPLGTELETLFRMRQAVRALPAPVRNKILECAQGILHHVSKAGVEGVYSLALVAGAINEQTRRAERGERPCL
jgi:hypothetical protein